MKQKSRNFIIPLIVYPFDVMCSFGQTDDELKKNLKKYGVEWDDKMKCPGQGRFIMTDEHQSILRLRSYPETFADYGNLQHEIFHTVTYVLDRIGMKFVLFKSDEAYSYLVGYLTKEIYKKL